MIIKHDEIAHSDFMRLLKYLEPAGDNNKFLVSDLSKKEIEETCSPEQGEQFVLVREEEKAVPCIWTFARLTSVKVTYSDGFMYFGVVIEIPDRVPCGIADQDGKLKKDYNAQIKATSDRILLEIYRILKGIDD